MSNSHLGKGKNPTILTTYHSDPFMDRVVVWRTDRLDLDVDPRDQELDSKTGGVGRQNSPGYSSTSPFCVLKFYFPNSKLERDDN